ncbi:MAG: pilus assembly protein [Pyrinomonadaceae bacterium]|nr:pilus assembly protein [Pyrinomonadaceae bacterium]
MKMRTGRKYFFSRFATNERGTQMIELAIVLPLLFLLIAGVAEFGRYFYSYTTLAKATRAGARYVTRHAYNSTTQTEAKRFVVYGKTTAPGPSDKPILKNLTINNVQITPIGGSSTTQPDQVKVSIINYSQDFGFGSVTKINWLTINVSPSTTMRFLWLPT